MKKNQRKKIKKTPNPKFTPEQQEMDADLDTYTALDNLAKSEGGKLIIDSAIRDAITSIDILTSRYKTEPHVAIMALCADLDAKLNLVRMLTRAESQKEVVETLLKESLRESEGEE